MFVTKRSSCLVWRISGLTLVMVVCLGLVQRPAQAQVSIDMPPPPRAKTVTPKPPPSAVATTGKPANASRVSDLSTMQREGRQSLSRFAGARYGGDQRYPLGRRRYRSYYGPTNYGFGHFHFPFFFHSFNFGFFCN